MGIEKIVTVPSCYGFSLATGGLIIGYFELIINLLSMVVSTEDPDSFFYIVDCKPFFRATVTLKVNKLTKVSVWISFCSYRHPRNNRLALWNLWSKLDIDSSKNEHLHPNFWYHKIFQKNLNRKNHSWWSRT